MSKNNEPNNKLEEKLPSYVNFVDATYRALKELNVPSTMNEITSCVCKILNISDDVASRKQKFHGSHGQDMTEIRTHVSFCGTWLKHYGAFENSHKLWKITSSFENVDSLSEDVCRNIVNKYQNKAMPNYPISSLSVEDVQNKFNIFMSKKGLAIAIKEKNELTPKLGQFLKDFPDSKSIMNLSMEQFVYKYSSSTYCSRIVLDLEYGTTTRYRQGYWQLYNLYYNSKEGQFIAKVPGEMKKTSDFTVTNNVFNDTKQAVAKLVDSISDLNNKNLNKVFIASKGLNDLFAGKILFVYNSDNATPIYSAKDLSNFAYILGLSRTSKQTFIENNIAIANYFKDNIKPFFNEATQFVFMEFLYDRDYGLRDFLDEMDGIPLTKVQNISAVKSPSVDNFNQDTSESVLPIRLFRAEAIKTLTNNEFTEPSEADIVTNNGRKPRLHPGSNHDKNNETGKKGEKKVAASLQNTMDFLGHKIISDIHKNFERDDELGYDIDFTIDTGEIIYIDVKASSCDHRGNVRFFISGHEYLVLAKKHEQQPNSYYICFVDNIDNPTDIKAIPSEDIIGNNVAVTYSLNLKENSTVSVID